MHLRHFAVILVALVGISCGSTSTPTTPTPNSSSTPTTPTPTPTPTPPTITPQMSAVIGGVAWNSLLGVGVAYVPEINFLTMSGTDTTGVPTSSTRTLGLGLFLTGTGTYTINDNSYLSFQVTIGTQVWEAGGGFGGTGTITVSAFSTHAATGTFSFTANPVSGGATSTKVVTNGTFNVTY